MLITLMQWAEQNGCDKRTARKKAADGNFKTALKIGRDWFIEETEPKVDLRFKKNKTVTNVTEK